MGHGIALSGMHFIYLQNVFKLHICILFLWQRKIDHAKEMQRIDIAKEMQRKIDDMDMQRKIDLISKH